MGWALDGGEDIGGQMADHDMWLEEMARISDIKEDRKRRMKALSGKFIVSTTGHSSGRPVFIQDRRINEGGYWTQYLSNAVGYADLEKAKSVANGFKYGNPKIGIVTPEGNYKWIS